MESGHDPRVTPSLDMSDHKDRKTVRGLATRCGKRWPISEEFRGELITCLRAAAAIAMQNKLVRDMTDCVKTAAILEGQNQSDEHLEDKNARMDTGKPTDVVATQYRVMFDGEANGA